MPDSNTRNVRRYSEEADLYQSAVEPVFRPVIEDVLSRANAQPGEHVLDVGTGPGLLAILAGEKVGPQGRVLGVDLAEGMVQVAIGRAAHLPQVTFERGDVNQLPLPDASFDVALSSFALSFADPNRALPELKRVLRPQTGRLAAILQGLNWGLTRQPLKAISDARQQFLSSDAIDWAEEIDHDRKRVIARWAVIEREVILARLEQLGFAEAEYHSLNQQFHFASARALWDWYYAGTGLRRFIDDWAQERQAAFHAAMAAAVASVTGDGPLVQEWEIITLFARR